MMRRRSSEADCRLLMGRVVHANAFRTTELQYNVKCATEPEMSIITRRWECRIAPCWMQFWWRYIPWQDQTDIFPSCTTAKILAIFSCKLSASGESGSQLRRFILHQDFAQWRNLASKCSAIRLDECFSSPSDLSSLWFCTGLLQWKASMLSMPLANSRSLNQSIFLTHWMSIFNLYQTCLRQPESQKMRTCCWICCLIMWYCNCLRRLLANKSLK
jgi:hypothetical protein